MENLFVIVDYISNGYKSEALDIFSGIALLFGTVVIILKNPISSLISLIGLFGAISVYLIIIGLDFIGFSYLIVYIGAVSILFLFILMLIDIRNSELLSNNGNSLPLALLIIILLNYVWIELSPEYITFVKNSDGIIKNLINSNIIQGLVENLKSIKVFNGVNTLTHVMHVSSNSWDGFMVETSHISGIGMVLYTVYNMWLLIASLILLLAMVGCIIITLK